MAKFKPLQYSIMKRTLSILLILFVMSQLNAQDHAPYAQIPDYPSEYTPGTVAARMVDGLGYRYYWASEGLRTEDLSFKPSEDGRTAGETIDHIYGLSRTIVNAARKLPNGQRNEKELTFEEMRLATLENFKAASDLLLKADDLSENLMIFQRSGGSSEYPYWNMINGPISDAIYHTGQIVTFRRSSGNPMNPKVSVLTGKNRD